MLLKRQGARQAPLALNQEGLWFIEQLEPGTANHSIPGTVRLRGKLDLAALEQSLGEIVRRHEVLRTRFAMYPDGKPYQEILDAQPLSIPVTDLTSMPSPEREALRLATEAATTAFDLSEGRLFRVSLLRLGSVDHVLCVNFHHIIADGWSMGVFTRELAALYRACLAGDACPLSEPEVQFSDFALWQRSRWQGRALEAELAFWRQQLAGATVLNLPSDRPRPERHTYRGSHEAVSFSPVLSDHVRRLARQNGCTPYMVVLAAFEVLLYHLSGQDDIVIGTTFANRNVAELEKLIGLFVNTLPLRCVLAGDASFRELLGRVRERVLGLSAHQELPLAKLVNELQPERDLGKNPLYQVVFDFLTPDKNPALYGYGLSSTVSEELNLPDLQVTPMDVEGGVARFDIAVFIWDQPEAMTGTFEYSKDLFDKDTIRHWIDLCIKTLGFAVATPDMKLGDFSGRLTEADAKWRACRQEVVKDSVHRKLGQIKRRTVAG